MRIIISGLVLSILASCTAAKVSVPEQFSSEASKMHVKGLNGWMINQKLSFGNYQTSSVKRGWDFGSSFQHTKFFLKPEEMLLRVFEVETDKKSLSQRNKFQYTLYDGKLEAAIFATEKFNEKQLVYKSKNPWIGEVTNTQGYEYAFTAGILTSGTPGSDPWSVVISNKASREKGAGLFQKPQVEEQGFATNGKETIKITPLRIENVKQKNGKETKVFGGSLFSGYELKWDDGVVGIIDILDNNVWIANNLDAHDKLIVASVSSAVLLKRMKDVEKDKEELASQ